MLIEIKGVQFVNKGAELMLYAILQQLKIHLPDAEICLAHNTNSPYIKRAEIGAFQKISLLKNILDFNRVFYFIPKKIRQYFKNRFGIVTEADVDVILDASGFSYGDQWSDLVLHQVANEVTRLKKQNKKYIFLPQSLGPFTREKNKEYAHKAFSNASLVFAREKPSFEHIDQLNNKSTNLFRAPDFTNLLCPNSSEKFAKYKNYFVVIPNSKMLSSKNKDTNWKSNYIEVIKTLIEKALNDGENVVILNHSGKDDEKLCKAIQSELSQVCDIIEPATALDVKAVIGSAKAIVSSRFHGCVSALSQGIPCLATSWSHKYLELFKEYDSEHLLLDSKSSKDSLNNSLNQVLNPESEWLENLNNKAADYKSQSTEMWQQVVSVIKCS
jgi:colanic acid/amylovoran biosynthesis protein